MLVLHGIGHISGLIKPIKIIYRYIEIIKLQFILEFIHLFSH